MKITESATLLQGQAITPLQSITTSKHEKVIYHYDEATGLKAIVAIHNSTLGPGLGGARIWDYAQEEQALTDALRLSEGMTYKSALAGLDLGGAKAVIIGDVNKIKNEAFLRKYARFVESLHGSYITAPDVNTNMDDMIHIAKETQYVVGLPTTHQGSGDPSVLTAYGTYMGIKAMAKKMYGSDHLTGKKIGIQGVGKVGFVLVDYLIKEGAIIYVTDILPDRLSAVVKEYNVQVIEDVTSFYGLDMDIYAPCALGGTINDQTISQLKCQGIAGAANNQLANEEKHGRMLIEKGIMYAPDFLINAGGVINVHTEWQSAYNSALAHQQVENIYKTCFQVLQQSEQHKTPTQKVAIQLAQQRIESVKNARLV